jgi:hypothetical protein
MLLYAFRQFGIETAVILDQLAPLLHPAGEGF